MSPISTHHDNERIHKRSQDALDKPSLSLTTIVDKYFFDLIGGGMGMKYSLMPPYDFYNLRAKHMTHAPRNKIIHGCLYPRLLQK